MTPWLDDGDVRLYHGDALEVLRGLPDGSVDCCVTSPPYWGLRDYGTGEWEGGDPNCDHRVRQDARVESSTLGGGKESCPRCGARRVDQQLGLEPTPDLFVQNMVAVFREVRRVLADHGTCWVNLGDSYASGEIGRHDGRVEGSGYGARHPGPRQQQKLATGLKPKDLVGIPWRVAFALQQPYYTGRIKDERDRIWLAATIEAEGCLFIHKRKAGTDSGAKFTKKDGTEVSYARTQDTYGSGLEVASTDRVIVERCMALTGVGSICEQSPEQNARRKQTIYRWNVRSNECRWIIQELYPHLYAKQHEARLLIGCPSSGKDAEKAHESLKAIHQGGTPTIDFPAPASLFEEGWYVRSDVIWAKKNCMPESVTDRPTKSHEYVFLLTKQSRYFFDQEAVRERYVEGIDPRGFRHDNYVHDEHHPTRGRGPDGRKVTKVEGRDGSEQHRNGERWPNPSGRNVRSVWQIATQPYPEAHFATFPEALARRCIVAGCPSRVCRVCGKPSERIVEVERVPRTSGGPSPSKRSLQSGGAGGAFEENLQAIPRTVGWSDCGHNNWRPGTVLDPFMGSGTVAKVARDHQRHAIGIDLNEQYLELAARRLQQLSLLNEATA